MHAAHSDKVSVYEDFRAVYVRGWFKSQPSQPTPGSPIMRVYCADYADIYAFVRDT